MPRLSAAGISGLQAGEDVNELADSSSEKSFATLVAATVQQTKKKQPEGCFFHASKNCIRTVFP
ncbi:hypothetical protein NJC38_28335 [Pseudomonas sp. 21LCFQ010]|uniref:hypothetical protein n=1 Tax=Pseudomonas sp. 21LCFQ010 TaxID=2957506 RepID=UPI002097180B|nr:hypothetical protein [Pseudomonas sp. 21LCFQ010]MCO8166040.1 hypothetical protein [Pseudomonas sp. 21LCFQ010]